MLENNFKYQNISDDGGLKVEEGSFRTRRNHKCKETTLRDFFREDPETFLLNNILMSLQFFQNYERDVETLRDTWYKDIKFEEHDKRCFYADSLFKLINNCVHFQPRHGPQKNMKYPLHSQRIFIISDNVEAAFDPSVLTNIKTITKPFYQLTVRPCQENKKEKYGYVSLVEFKSLEGKSTLNSNYLPEARKSYNALLDNMTIPRNSIYARRPSFETKPSRRLTKTEKILSLQNNISLSKTGRRSSLKMYGNNVDEVLENGFYSYAPPSKRFNPKHIRDYRMNGIYSTSIKIPRKCFQRVEIKRTTKRSITRGYSTNCFISQNLLNSAAFKGYLCDLLFKQLGEALDLDLEAVSHGTVQGEFILVSQEGVKKCIIPGVNIKHWTKYIEMGKKLKAKKNRELQWPTTQMKKIIQILPCHALPIGFLQHNKENLDYEKEWKLDFPKAEEFLLLHMMHSHLKCYIFTLIIYKSFLENEVNNACFGPKHLLHLLFWLVHKNFLAWPDDRPGQNLIKFLRILYKKLQNKTLYDFFISHRNLFANSQLKDLHKAQTIIKRILENPLPYILRAIKNLNFEEKFYPKLDILKLYENLKIVETPKNKTKKRERKGKEENLKYENKREFKTENGKKAVRFEIDEERQWTKDVIKQIKKEKKEEEEEKQRSLSLDSIPDDVFLLSRTFKHQKCQEIVENFIFHFIEMGLKCVEFENLDQALMYLYQANKLYGLLPKQVSLELDFGGIREKINRLKVKCDKLERHKTFSIAVQTKETQITRPLLENTDEKPKPLEVLERKSSGSFSSQYDSDGEMETKL